MGADLAFLGPEGTFTHQAAMTFAGAGSQLRAMPSQAACLQAVQDGTSQYAVVPIDNAVNGLVIPTIDALLARRDLSIIDSLVLPVSFDAYTTGDVTPLEIVSHPHALAQCEQFIARHGLRAVEAASTAAACRDLIPGQIALGAQICGDLYPIQRIESGVETRPGAITQFAVIARTPAETKATSAGAHGMVFSLEPTANQPGTLFDLLLPLKERKINVANLLTRPVLGAVGKYVEEEHTSELQSR